MTLSSQAINLNVIEKTELSSVVFIRDYIQLIFEGRTQTYTLTTFTLPIIIFCGMFYSFQVLGYRDTLCSLISQKVIKTEIHEKVAIRLFFKNDTIVEISLRNEDREGPESAMFSDGIKLSIW